MHAEKPGTNDQQHRARIQLVNLLRSRRKTVLDYRE